MKRAPIHRDEVRAKRIAKILQRTAKGRSEVDFVGRHGIRKDAVQNRPPLPVIPTLYVAKRWYVMGALRLHDGNITQAAKALGIERSSLQRMLKKFASSPETTNAPP